jgi:hypothetical protein
MTEYISRDVAVNGLAKIINESDMPEDWNKGMSAAMSALFRIPAADVRPVVLCKDCVHFQKVRPHDGFCKMFFKMDGMLLNNDFFCANGKREES